MEILKGFEYMASTDSRVLILGSMPGVESLKKVQYYAHPRNLFWTIMSDMFGFNIDLPYVERLGKLEKYKIALWDVVHQCRRKGSLDSNIEINSLEANDFCAFFKEFQQIHTVLFNGRKSEELYKRFVLKDKLINIPELEYYCLPSTSPANASIPKERKVKEWSIVKHHSLI